MENNTSKSAIGTAMKAAIIAALLLAVGVTVYMKGQKTAPPAIEKVSATVPSAPLPKLVDLGATKCIPCKMMAPILEEMKLTCAGKLEVVFIDVWEKPEEADKYNINLIPTQVFFDAAGKELFRHEGFFAREDIVAKWKELGVELPAPTPAKGP